MRAGRGVQGHTRVRRSPWFGRVAACLLAWTMLTALVTPVAAAMRMTDAMVGGGSDICWAGRTASAGHAPFESAPAGFAWHDACVVCLAAATPWMPPCTCASCLMQAVAKPLLSLRASAPPGKPAPERLSARPRAPPLSLS